MVAHLAAAVWCEHARQDATDERAKSDNAGGTVRGFRAAGETAYVRCVPRVALKLSLSVE